MYLLDSSLVAALRRPEPPPALAAWFEGLSEESLYLAALTAGEIQAAIETIRTTDPAAAEALSLWLDRLVGTGRVLAADHLVFRTWAQLLQGKPRHLSEDALIAATAKVHGLTVATLNPQYFESFGVALVAPLAEDAQAR